MFWFTSVYLSGTKKSVLSLLTDSSDSEGEDSNRFLIWGLSKENRDILLDMFDEVPSRTERFRSGLILDKPQEEILKSVWSCLKRISQLMNNWN